MGWRMADTVTRAEAPVPSRWVGLAGLGVQGSHGKSALAVEGGDGYDVAYAQFGLVARVGAGWGFAPRWLELDLSLEGNWSHRTAHPLEGTSRQQFPEHSAGFDTVLFQPTLELIASLGDESRVQCLVHLAGRVGLGFLITRDAIDVGDPAHAFTTDGAFLAVAGVGVGLGLRVPFAAWALRIQGETRLQWNFLEESMPETGATVRLNPADWIPFVGTLTAEF